MKITIIAIIPLLMILASCNTPTDSMSNVGPLDSPGADTEESVICHGNMRDIMVGVWMFYGINNRYPECIEELSVVDPALCSLTCPSCSLTYIYQLDSGENIYTISCPMPIKPNHGQIVNGEASWPPDPYTWPSVCHSNMANLASCCAMYYGKYDIYPDDLDDLIAEGFIPEHLECPACGDEYHYAVDSLGQEYMIECPMPVRPNHGRVVNGRFSWPPDTSGFVDICRANMIGLRSGMAIFYGMFNRYPRELSELGSSGVMDNWNLRCPGCNELYIYTSDLDSTYRLECPLGVRPNHGSVIDGCSSWE